MFTPIPNIAVPCTHVYPVHFQLLEKPIEGQKHNIIICPYKLDT